MLINVPIESLEERYSAQWNTWFPVEFNRLHINYTTVDPHMGKVKEINRIRNGQFLDVFDTNIYKARQLEVLCRMLRDGQIKSGDTVFFHDLWFPGIEMLFYIRDAMKIDFKVAGMLHAGTYDPHDYLTQCGMERWAHHVEAGWLNEVDTVFFATSYHYNLVRSAGRWLSGGKAKPAVVRFPLMWKNPWEGTVEKENIVVFPHRLAPEKAPEIFEAMAGVLAPEFPHWTFISTKHECVTKDAYWKMLAHAKVAVSCAYQETWGIAQQEAVLSDCLPVVPNRLSYPEMYSDRYRYETFEELCSKTRHMMLCYEQEIFDPVFQDQKRAFVEHGRFAIHRMMDFLGVVDYKVGK